MDSKILIQLALIVVAGVLVVYLVDMYCKNKNKKENFEGHLNKSVPQASQANDHNEVYASVDEKSENEEAGNQYPADCFPKDRLSPEDLLPGDANSKWAQVTPAGQGEIGDQNFLNAGYHTGVNTVGQTLRNANLQIRSEPPNPQAKVSPWLQSTIEPDTNRKPLEIGGCE